MLEVQLAMLGLLVLKSLIALIEVICIQIVCLFKSYYIPTKDLNLNMNLNYEKNYSYINDYNEIMFYV
jgi:hypothetical protein